LMLGGLDCSKFLLGRMALNTTEPGDTMPANQLLGP
jgi:hypothetical protein